MVVRQMPFVFTACGLTDIGLVRENNEDAWGEASDEHFFVLADGMGGHLAGEVASRELVEGLCSIIKRSLGKKSKKKRSIEDTKNKILHGIEQVNTKIFAMSYTSETLRGMGTTLCFLFFHEDGLIYGHVGDSRIYRVRSKNLEQLTTDHSLLRELLDQGQITQEQAGEFLYKNILTRAIGTEPEVEPSVVTDAVLENDLYLMCSDGLTDMLSPEEISSILIRSATISDKAYELVRLAKQKGGVDNITVILVQVKQDEISNISRS
jgi:protein phosphatase